MVRTFYLFFYISEHVSCKAENSKYGNLKRENSVKMANNKVLDNQLQTNVPTFHPKCGQLVTLTSTRRTATRSYAAQEFNHGLVFSNTPLCDNQIFEVKLDKKVNSWSGSIEVGVTACDPDSLESPLPSSATELRRGSWIMSGNSILKDGRSIHENYGAVDLDKLDENDR